MSSSLSSVPSAAESHSGGRSLRLPFGLSWSILALAGIAVLAAILRFANSDAIGQANTYYTAGVESMLQSWHNFFFVAAEPGGSVSIDKPPVGLWLQAISAYFLGVSGFSVVLPQILAGIGSVIVIFFLVRRWFGDGAGLLASLVLAVTPVAIAVERNNTPDATLIFTLLLAAWGFIKATETGKLRYLLIGAALVGVGFNIKMMQALLPLPAMYALYLFGAKQGWWRKILNLGIATLVLIPIALSWATIVDLTPADQRPYVGSSSNNSVYDLIFGYNGIQRLEGRGGGGGFGGGQSRNDGGQSQTTQDDGQNGASQAQDAPQTDDGQNAPPQMQGNAPSDGGQNQADGNRSNGGQGGVGGGPGGGGQQGGGGPGGGGGSFGTGEAGVLRLFQSGLASQVSWLLPFGLVAMAAMAWGAIRRWSDLATRRGLLLWGGWLLTCAVFFSIAGFFHQYYLAMMGPPLAAIVAIGAAYLWQLYKEHPIQAAVWLLVAAGVTLAFQLYAATMYNVQAWWVFLPAVIGVLGLGLLLINFWRRDQRLAGLAFAGVLAAVLIIPSVWSGMTVAYSTNSSLPTAYTGSGGRGGFGMGDGGGRIGRSMPTDGGQSSGGQPGNGGQPGGEVSTSDSELISYLEANTQDVKYLVVVPSSRQGASLVLTTGRPVLYAGGFSGADPVIDSDSLAKLVADGEVRYVLWSGNGGGGGGSRSNISSYLESSCTVVSNVSSSLYQCGS